MLREDSIDRRIARLPGRLRWAAGALRITLREPADGLDRARTRLRRLTRGHRPQPRMYVPAREWHELLHERLGVSWPCAVTPEFDELWKAIVERVQARGVSLGRGTYGGWDDADPALARAVWCLARHLQPRKVLETGVARGITSRVILESLVRSHAGHLWSIDLPATDPMFHDEIGIAVPDGLRDAWTYVRGTSRARLQPLLREIAPIDLFVHDSSHTDRNVRFELAHAWRALAHGGIIADDIQQSAAFASFVRELPESSWIVAEADDGSALFGIVLKRD
jgi:hypothetical protein